jgi:hypothetical protein
MPPTPVRRPTQAAFSGDELAFSSVECRTGADGRVVWDTCSSNIYVVRADGSERDFILADGQSPARRP